MKFKMMAIAIGGVFVCSTSLILIVSHLSEKALTQQILMNLQALSSSQSSELAESFKKLHKDVKGLSDSKFIQDAFVSYESVAYGTGLDLDEDNEIQSNTYFSSIESKYAETFQDYASALPIQSFALVLNNGFTISKTGESSLIGKNLLKGSFKSEKVSDCVQKAKANDHNFTGIVVEKGLPKMYLCQKVISRYDRDGYQKNSQMGYLIAELKWDFIAKLKNFHSGLGKTGQLYLSDGRRIITPPRHLSDLKFEELLKLGLELSEDEMTLAADEFRTGFLQEKVLRTVQPIQVSGEINWNLIGQISEEEALASVRNLKMWSYLTLVFCLLVISVFSWISIVGIVKNFVSNGNHISNCSEEIDTASKTFKEVAATVSSGMQQQSSALEQTSASIEEMNAMVAKTLSLSKSSTDKASVCNSMARDGENKMQNLLKSVEAVNTTTLHSFDQVKESSLSSLEKVLVAFKAIEEKTKVINDIAFQTKLLSFNAAVEAARAGEQGKGFSVVAEEVGTLANSVNTSSKEIDQLLSATSDLISEMSKSTAGTIEAAVNSAAQSSKSSRTNANEGLKFFKDLALMIQQINGEVHEVHDAADEQSKGINEINKAIIEIARSNQSTVGTILQLEQQTDVLVHSSQTLDQSTQQMNQILFGGVNDRAEALGQPQLHLPKAS